MILERLLGLTKVLGPSSAASFFSSPSSAASFSSFPPLSLFSGDASHLCSHQQCAQPDKMQELQLVKPACDEHGRDLVLQSLWSTV